MSEQEGVMQRLDAQTRRLKERMTSGPASAVTDEALTLESLMIVSEALLRIGRDIRHMRLQTADRP